MMRIGVAADHGGIELKTQLTAALKAAGYQVVDFGAHELVTGDDYPDFVVPMARALASGEVAGAWPSAVRGRCLRCGQQGARRTCSVDYGILLRSSGSRR